MLQIQDDVSPIVFIFAPFLTFVIFHIPSKGHNMLAIMLDLQFKSMNIVCEFVDNDAMVQGIMKGYNQEIVLPMLLQMYFHLNLVRLRWNFDLVKHVHNDEYCGYGEKGEPLFTQKNDV